MSITGSVVFYTESQFKDMHRGLSAIMGILGADDVQSLYQHSRQPYSWQDVVDNDEDGEDFDPVAYMKQLAENPPKHDTRVPYEETLLLSDCTAEEAAVVIKNNLFYEMFFSSKARIGLVMEQHVREISETVRDTFIPCSPSISIGPHDVFDAASEPPQLFGHAMLSIGFFGYGAPHDWQRYRELVFEVPFIKQLQANLEAIVGPLQRCAYWNF